MFPFIVLEGSPGQGKSTISQYVCQIHRMRIIGESASASRLPSSHISSPVKLPFKVELRDFALWLRKINPFVSRADEEIEGWQPSLESFLSAQVRHFSGGVEFIVADLHAVVRHSAVFLALDGLDEVADLGLRKKVMFQIETGMSVSKKSQLHCRLSSRVVPQHWKTLQAFQRTCFNTFLSPHYTKTILCLMRINGLEHAILIGKTEFGTKNRSNEN